MEFKAKLSQRRRPGVAPATLFRRIFVPAPRINPAMAAGGGAN
jgi:hypothetical protein